MTIKTIAGVLAVLAASAPAFSKIMETKVQPDYRITISTGFSLQNHFDGNGTLEWQKISNSLFTLGNIPEMIGFINPGAQLQLALKITEKYQGALSVNRDYAYYGEKCHQCGRPGDILMRDFTVPNMYVSWNLLEAKSVNIDALIGVSAKIGWESVIVNYGVFDVHLLNRELRDVGFVGGVSVYRDIAHNRVRISTTVKYNEFLHRHDRGQRSNYAWDSGSSRRMVSYVFTAGYRFGKSTRKAQ